MKTNPPRLAQRFFSWYCKNHLHDSILGDLEEQFNQNKTKYGLWGAKWRYCLGVLLFMNRFTLKRRQKSRLSNYYSANMFKNNLISYRRFLGRNKSFAFINIFGLTLGLSSFFLILFFVNHELSYDQFHVNKEHVFRVNFSYKDNAGNVTTLVNSPPALAPGIEDKFPELEKITRLRYAMNCLLSNGDTHFYEGHGYYADSLFLEILKFEMLSGDPNTALDQSNSIVITQEMALKYFNEPDPIGATLVFNNSIPLTITGVLADIPENSHLDFNFLVSFPTYTVPDGYASDLTSWGWLGFLTYVKLKPNTDSKQFEEGLAQHFIDLNPDDLTPLVPIVQNISDIYLGSAEMTDDLASHIRSGSQFSVRALFLVAILILAIAGFNFSNLSHAMSINRIKSVGVRKLLGADKRGILTQLLIESLFLTFLCVGLSVGIVFLVFSDISQFMMWEFSLESVEIWKVIILLISSGIFIGISAGLYPALNLAKIDIVKSFKGALKIRSRSPFQLKNVLLTFQFAVSIGLICATFIMTRQINYLSNKETGYSAENVVMIKLLPEDMSRFFKLYKEQLSQHVSVMDISRSERVVGEPWPFSAIRNVGEDPDLNKMIFFNQAGYDYFSTMGVSLKNGRAFSAEYLNDSTKSIIINQKAAEHLGLEDPIGKQVHFFELDGPRTIVGVVENFNYTSLHQEIGPAVVVLPFIDLEYMYVRFSPGNSREHIDLLEDTWSQISGGIPLEWRFLDTDLERLYQSEEKLSTMIQGFSILAILLACLGLYGMVTFMVNNRVKEVGVRKVLGASTSSLYMLFIRSYFYQTLVAIVITLPLIHYLLTNWLQEFAYHIEISWWTYPLAVLLLIGIILLTVTAQILGAAKTNPTDLLRHE